MATRKVTRNLSLESMNEWLKELKGLKSKQIPNVALRTVDRLTDEMIKNAYPDTEKIPAKMEENKAIGGMQNKKSKWAYKEYGTGIVGSQNPHVAEALQQAGWKYDVNKHGEKGWIYPKGDGSFGWTKGLPAEKKFYEAIRKMEDSFPEIAKEEFNK